MDVLGDLVARDRRSDRPAVHLVEAGRSISYHDFCTTSYKAGNVLRYLGLRKGAIVAIVGRAGPQPLWAFYGAGQLGAAARFVGRDTADSTDARVLLAPVTDEETLAPQPATKLATYGGAPTRATTLHWEKELWSENPAVHPADVDSADPLLEAGTTTYSHGDVLGAARRVRDEFGFDDATRVAVRGPLSEPHVVTAGLVAPVLAGGTVVVPAEDSAVDVADVAVVGAEDDAPEPAVCRAADVAL